MEKQIREHGRDEAATRAAQLEHAGPVVDALFGHVEDELQSLTLLPSDPCAKAVGYLHSRRAALSVYPEKPGVAIGGNHLERALRPISTGRRSWPFCRSELGARQVGIIRSLVTTCRLHDVDPGTYLTDVL